MRTSEHSARPVKHRTSYTTSRPLDRLKFSYEKTPVKHKESLRRLYKDYKKEADRQLAKNLLKWVCTIGVSVLTKARHKFSAYFPLALKRRAFHYQPTWKDVIIALLLGLLLAQPVKASAPEVPFVYQPHKLITKKLRASNGHPRLKEVHVHIATPAPRPAVAPVRAPQAIKSTANCSGYGAAAAQLIARESGCNPYAVNPSSGACGIAQELPCGKSGCGLGNGACQLAWMNRYVHERYGGWEQAWAHELAYGWY